MDNRKLNNIVERLMNGEKEVFLELCELKSRDILYFAYKILQNMQDAEDITQEIFVYVFDHIHELQQVDAFQVWLYQIARRKSINMLKKREQIARIVDKSLKNLDVNDGIELFPDGSYNHQLRKEVLLKVLDELSVNKKFAMLMFYFEGMKYEDIARVMETTKKTVESYLVSVRRAVSDYLEAYKQDKMKEARPVMISLPAAVIAESIGWESNSVIAESSIQKVIKGTINQIAYFNPDPGSAAQQDAKSLPKNFKAMSITIGVMAAGGLTLGGYLYKQQLLQPYDLVSMKEEQRFTEISSDPEEQEAAIHTLEDMIGEQEAAILRQLYRNTEVRMEEVDAFLKRHQFLFDERIWDVEEHSEYSMYSLEKQNKRLSVLVRRDEQTEHIGLAYQLMDIDTEKPDSFYIILRYQEWKAEE